MIEGRRYRLPTTMELTTILNRFLKFCLPAPLFVADKSIEVVVRPRTSSAAVCSRDLSAPVATNSHNGACSSFPSGVFRLASVLHAAS